MVILKSFIILILITAKAYSSISIPQSNFPVDYEMRKRVNFWKKVYTEINTNRGYIHDTDRPWIIYENISLKGLNRKKANKKIKHLTYRVKLALNKLAKRKKNKQSIHKMKYANLVGNLSVKNIRKSASKIRFQRGMSDRFYKGHKKAFKYLDHMKKIFTTKSLPLELTYLPHVESSFNIKAHSKSDAVGIWQVLKPIGRKLGLMINQDIDERLDPIKSSRAAALLLKENYKVLGSWPLAVTAYNTGPAILRRAVKKLKTSNLSTIVEKFRARNWGFASRNFYATFVAVTEVSININKYANLRSWKKESPISFQSIKTTEVYPLPKLLKALGKYKNEFIDLNPAIRKRSFKKRVLIPRDFTLHLPSELISKKGEILKQLK
ncbi:MAG: lytic transglycosylase domain-containing protein [Bacteriovoracaceae bacterium]